MKRKLAVLVAVAVGVSWMAVIAADRLIDAAAEGKTFFDATVIPHRRVALLLGCSRQLSNGRNNLFFAYRVAAAQQLYQNRKMDYLIVSGDNQTVGYDEATDLKRALVAGGIPVERIYCDYAGFRTLDSIVRAKEVFGQTNIIVISQEFHNQRAIYIARHEGIDALGFNARDVVSFQGYRTRFREYFARVKTVLDLYLLRTRPKFLGSSITIGDPRQP